MGRALLTDLYEINMAASYLRRGMTQPATFSLFVRTLPPGWGFFVACGLERCLEHLETFRFADDELEYLRREQGYPPETLAALRDLRFTGDVWAIPEGRVFFPEEPVLEVTAPLPEAQLVETFLLNQITYQTAVASKAARCRLAAPDKQMVDFAFRRAHGVEASIAVARAAAIVGFAATSNVEAARVLGVPATGTMAHSYVEAFASELEAFRAYTEDFPDRVVLLVDTYDTERGVEKAIATSRELGVELRGIRIDSGDLESLAKEARRALDEAGLSSVRIIASGGLDEHEIARLERAGAPIDVYGGFTKVAVSADAPYLDSVYKLVEYAGRPVAKLSAAKATLPGRKQVWRRAAMDGDVIGLRDQSAPSGAASLLERVMESGRRVEHGGINDARSRFSKDLAELPDSLRSLEPTLYPVTPSDELLRLSHEVHETIRERELG